MPLLLPLGAGGVAGPVYIRRGGAYVRYEGGYAIDKELCDCECEEILGCCGRSQPGPDSLEGPEYYPLTLHCRISIPAGSTCVEPNQEVEFDVEWDPANLEWSNLSIDMGDGSTAVLRFECSDETGWGAGFEWDACSFAGNPMSFDLIPTLTDGECDPVDLEATLAMNGLMCCGSLVGGSVLIEVWE